MKCSNLERAIYLYAFLRSFFSSNTFLKFPFLKLGINGMGIKIKTKKKLLKQKEMGFSSEIHFPIYRKWVTDLIRIHEFLNRKWTFKMQLDLIYIKQKT